MSAWGTITWDVARTGGFVAYALVTISVALGLALSLRWRSTFWPRWATNDLHQYITLLALVFIGIHTVAVWLDPFMAFGPAEVFVPLVSHYRPIWMALGIVATYLMLAVWLSGRVQRQIGYAWWRRLHYVTFLIYGLSSIHGIATGSDTRTTWALAIYAVSVILVGSLLALRLLGPAPHLTRRPRLAGAVAVIVLIAGVWTALGPLRPGWNAAANSGHGSGARIALASGVSSEKAGRITAPFIADLSGPVSQSNSGGIATVQIHATLQNGMQGTLRITMQGQPDAAGGLSIARTAAVFTPAGRETYRGQVTALNEDDMIIDCTGAQGDRLQLDVRFQVDGTGLIQGRVQGSPAQALAP